MDRFKIKTAVYAIIERKGKILLLKRYNTGWKDGYYTLPSGHIDEHELPTETMIRELKEEVGLIVNHKDLEFIHVLYEKGAYIDFYYKVTSYTGNIKIMEPDKCDELLWEENIKENNKIITKVKLALLHYKNGIRFSEINHLNGN